MNTQYTYLLIHAASLAGPLLLSFDKKVAFYKKWRFLFPAMLLPAVLFLIWDEYFTQIGVWSFSEAHTIGVKLGHLPLEEVLFFFTVPYCCVFIYECIRIYFPRLQQSRTAELILFLLGFLLLLLGLFFSARAYTAYTFILNGAFIAVIFLFRRFFSSFDALFFLVSYLVIIVPFLIVNGFLTAIPVVMYNDAENLGIRMFSFLPWPMHNIPFEDLFYGMLLILMNVTIYEKLKNR
ncbi:MAG: lycopene cyclase domain-containing protein [Chitinophagaceae bacterium]